MLDAIRARVGSGMIWFLWLHVPLVLATGLLVPQSGGMLAPIMAAILFCLLPTVLFFKDRHSPLVRYMTASSMMLMTALLVFMFRAHPWQIDVHMYFFAALATISLFCDWRALLVAAAVTAVHHLLFNFVAPAWVFPEGADLMRVVLHAVVVVLETIALTWLAIQLQAAFAASSAAQEEARQSEEEAQTAAKAADEARLSAEAALAEAKRTEEANRRLQEENEAERRQAIAQSEAQRKAMAHEFEQATSALRLEIEQLMEDLTKRANALESTAGTARNAVSMAAKASTHVMTNISTVSGNASDISTAIGEIAQQTTTSSRVAEEADKFAVAGVATINTLIDQATKVESVLNMISDISRQTNLLALNATIEAVKAGEAGKGFAVVASEVKSLAAQSSAATDEITKLVDAIKASTDEATSANQTVSLFIKDILDNATAISAAVEQQTSATREIAEAANDVNQDTGRANEAVRQLEGLIEQVGTASGETIMSVQELGTKNRDLSARIEAVLHSIRGSALKVAAE